MRSKTYSPRSRHDRRPPVQDGSMLPMLAVPVVILAVLWAASYPVLAAALVGAAAVAYGAVRFGLSALARRLHGRITEVDVPGFGTVRFRVDAR